MSDTPRTDAATESTQVGGSYVPSHFARQLERELAEAKVQIETQASRFDRTLKELAALREGVEKLAARFSQTGYFNSARELRALLK